MTREDKVKLSHKALRKITVVAKEKGTGQAFLLEAFSNLITENPNVFSVIDGKITWNFK